MIDPSVETHEAQALRRQLLQDKPASSTHRNVGFNVAIIDQNALFGECLCAGLHTADPDLTFSLYNSVKSWSSKSTPSCEEILLICLDAREFDQIAKNESDNINRLRKAGLPTRFLIVSSQDSPTNALIALESGASGYVPTTVPLAVLSRVLHLVHVGGVFVPASSLQQLSTQGSVEPGPSALDTHALSPRQMLVAKALRRGTPNKVIAYDLNMCESTVKVHVRHIMKKLKAKNRTQVAYLTNSMFPSEE